MIARLVRRLTQPAGAIVDAAGELVLAFRSRRAAQRWLDRVRIQDGMASNAQIRHWRAVEWTS